MRTLFLALFLTLLGLGSADEPKVTVVERPDWQEPILEKVSFAAETKSIDDLLGKKVDRPGSSWGGFIIFSCTAKENLGKRLLWIDAEVEFSNGFKRNFKGISFNIVAKGTEHDIAKIPFDAKSPVSVKSVRVTSVTIK